MCFGLIYEQFCSVLPESIDFFQLFVGYLLPDKEKFLIRIINSIIGFLPFLQSSIFRVVAVIFNHH